MGSGAAYLPPELKQKMAKLAPAGVQFSEGELSHSFPNFIYLVTFLGYGMSEAVCECVK